MHIVVKLKDLWGEGAYVHWHQLQHCLYTNLVLLWQADVLTCHPYSVKFSV